MKVADRHTLIHLSPLALCAELRPDRVVVINDASVARGGATGVALMSLQLLQQAGVPVTLISGDDGSVFREHYPTIDVVSVGSPHLLQGKRSSAAIRGLYNRRAQSVVERWIAENDTPRTVYHLHGWSKNLSPAVFLSLRSVASRVVLTAHDFFLVCPGGGYFNFQSQRPCQLKPMSASCLVQHCDRRSYGQKIWRSLRLAVRQSFCDLNTAGMTVLAVHDGMVPHLERGGIDKANVKVLRNPVTPWRSERVHCERNGSFLFVGRLEADKGVDLLAEAAHRAKVDIVVVGEGPLAAMLSSDYPNVRQVGWRSRAEIGELLLDARALVMPTRSRESFGLVAMEALVSGVPVVVSENAMIAEEVVSSGVGLSCNPLDVQALANVLTRLAADDELVAAMSHRAHGMARSLAPTPAEWTEALLGIYGGIISCSDRAAPEDASRLTKNSSADQLPISTNQSPLWEGK